MCQGVLLPVSPSFWLFSEGERRISQVLREPLRPFALLSDPGRTSARVTDPVATDRRFGSVRVNVAP